MIEIDAKTVEAEKFASRTLNRMPSVVEVATRSMINNMAFDVRQISLDWGIPRVMTVRNKSLLRATLLVKKAQQRGARVATLYMAKKDRWGGLLEQEVGGTMKRVPASLAARKGDIAKPIPSSNRLKGAFLTAEDVDIAHNSGDPMQRFAAFMRYIERSNYSKPFVLKEHPKFRPGLYVAGKRVSGKRGARGRRKLTMLRSFKGKGTEIKRRQWLWPSIQRYFSTHARDREWQKALRFALRVVSR